MLRLSTNTTDGYMNPFWSTTAAGLTFRPSQLSGCILALEEGDGTGTAWNDSSPSNDDGVLQAGASWLNGAVELDGTDDYISIAGGMAPLNGLTTATVVIAFTMDAIDGVVWGSDNSDGQEFIWVDSNGALYWMLTTGAVSANSTVSAGVRNVVICTKNGTSGETFLNGSSVATGTMGPLDQAGALYLGRYWSGPSWTNGRIHYCAHYDRVLTSDERALFT